MDNFLDNVSEEQLRTLFFVGVTIWATGLFLLKMSNYRRTIKYKDPFPKIDAHKLVYFLLNCKDGDVLEYEGKKYKFSKKPSE